MRINRVKAVMMAVAALCVWSGVADCAQGLASISGSCLSDNAVLQRGRKIPIWGDGPAGAAVTISFQSQEWTGTVGADGKWRVDIGPLKPHAKDVKEGDVLTCTVGGRTTELKNVLVGDVWLCLGQSNMDRFLGTDEDYPVLVDGDTRNYPNVRINGKPCVVPRDPPGRFMSALPYHFGRHLFEQGDVPIGILQLSASGESLHGFLSPDRWQRFLKETGASIDNEYHKKMLGAYPSTKWAGLQRLAPMAVAGVYWDQGEGNAPRFPTRYDVLLDLLYEQLCELFEYPRMPFLMEQKISRDPALPEDDALPAWLHYDGFNVNREEYATIGECMRRWSLRDPERRVTVACHDMYDNVHYWGKTFHAKRAARAALAMTQGKDLPVRAPELDTTTVEGNTIRVRLKGGDLVPARWVVNGKIGEDFAAEWAKLDQYVPGQGGVVVKWVSRASDTAGFNYSDWTAHVRVLDAGAPLDGFAIAGADALLWPATATVDGATVVVSNPEKVPKPKYVAYGLSVNGSCLDWNLYGKNGLPVLPFWSGDWPPGKIPGGAYVKVFTAEPEGFVKGTQTTLRWDVEGVDKVSIEPGIGDVPARGERKISPEKETQYLLHVPVYWPPVPSEPDAKWVLWKDERVTPKVFKPWRASAVPSALAAPVTSTGELAPGVVAEYRERAEDWGGTVVKEESGVGPRVLYDIATKVPEAKGRPVDIVFEGLWKIDRTGLCRFKVRDHNNGLRKEGSLASLEVGGVHVLQGNAGDELEGACLFDRAGYYPVRYRVRAEGSQNLVVEWTGPGGCDILDWAPVDRDRDLFWHTPE